MVRSDQGRWVTAHRGVYLTGGVVANDGTIEITSDEADYFEDSDYLLLRGNVHVQDRSLSATSRFGSYLAETRTAELWGDVEAVENGQTLRADRIVFHRDTGLAEAIGNVWAADSSGQTILTGQYVVYDRETQTGVAHGSPRLTRDEEGKVIVLTADTLRVDSANDIAYAENNVRMERDTLTATSDRAIFWQEEDRGLMVGSPRVWNQEIEATGDTIEVFTADGDIDRAIVRGSSNIRFENQSGIGAGETNELLSPKLTVFFSEGSLDSIHAVDGAVNRYRGVPRAGMIPEENEVQGHRIVVYFEEGQLGRAIVTGQPEGKYRFELAEEDSALATRETVDYDGERVEYIIRERDIEIEGNAHVAYQGMDLQSGRVVFDSEAGSLIARGNPQLNNPNNEELVGRTMTYDLESREGTVYQAKTEYDRGFYTGKAIHDAGDNVLLVKGATYTTCDHGEPHYSVGANTMKVQLRDKIIARPLILYIKKIPVFALPFYILPVNNERHSGIIFPQIQFGFTTGGGRFIRNLGYFWAPNDYMDFTLSGDYYELEPSWIGRFESRYNVLGKVQGGINTRYTGSRAFGGTRDQWELRATHNQTLDRNTRITAQGNFTSSRDFTRDPRTGEPLANRYDRFLVSTLNLNHRRTWGSFNFFLNRRQDLDTTPSTSPNLPELTEDLPRFDFVMPQRAIGRRASEGRPAFLPFLSSTYFNFSFRASNHSDRFLLTGDSTFTDHFFGTRASLSLNDNRRLGGGITFGPRVSSTYVLVDEDASGKKWSDAAVYSLGLGASGTYYGTFRTRVGRLRGIRHIFFPTISYNFAPKFDNLFFTDENGVLRQRFPATAGISIGSNEQSFLAYSVQNRFQIRFRRGEEEVTFPNFITWTTTGTYDFLWRENNQATPWGPVTNRINVQPPSFFSLDATSRHQFDAKPYFRSFNLNGGVRLSGGGGRPGPIADIPLEGNEALSRPDFLTGGPWNASLSYSFAAGRNPQGGWDVQQSANTLLSLSPTRNWHLDYYNTINLTDREITAQEFAVVRDLHCWQARFVRRFTSNGESEFFFRISIRDRPDVYLEQGTRGLGSFVNF